MIHETKNATLGQVWSLQIPEALELLSRSVFALVTRSTQVLDWSASEMEAPLATEFARCFEEQNFGIPLEEAIEDMAEANSQHGPSRFFATAIISATPNWW